MATAAPLPQGNPVWLVARELARVGTLYHRGDIDGLEHLPKGPALLVGNHGLFGLETPVFFFLVLQATGRSPVGLAERLLCRLPPMRRVLQAIGGVEGTRENAHALLKDGHLVVCYPGGAREVFKRGDRKYALAWSKATGFAKVAHEAQVPVVPFAAYGVDHTYRVLGNLDVAARLLGHEKYAVPLALGLGPLPLPARFRFRVGPPLPPPSHPTKVTALRDATEARVQALLDGLRAEAEEEEGVARA